MENDLGEFDLDESWLQPDDDPPAITIAPPPPEGSRPPPRPKRHQHREPEAGPWFPIAMGVFVVLGLLSMVAATAGTTGGAALAVGVAGGFGTIYLGVFLAGSSWFEGHRRGR